MAKFCRNVLYRAVAVSSMSCKPSMKLLTYVGSNTLCRGLLQKALADESKQDSLNTDRQVLFLEVQVIV